MTSNEINKESTEYLAKKLNERKNELVLKLPEIYINDIRKAYADGLKSGLKHHAHDYLVATKRRIEKAKAEKGWHNIKDNPQDLPTEDGQYLIYEIQYGDPWYDVARFITGANVFGTEHEKIIAWRELPKYEG